MISCTLLGSSGTLPRPNRGLTSLYTCVDGEGILIDCGEGTQVNFTNARKNFSDLRVICITHYHADHIFGLLGLLASLDQTFKTNADMRREAKVIIVAPKANCGILESLLSCIFLSKLKVVKVWIDVGTEEVEFKFPKFKIKAFRLCHTVECYGYAVEEIVNDPFSLEKAAEIPLDRDSWKFLQVGHRIICENEIYSIEDVTEGKRFGAKIVYATDTIVCDNLKRNAAKADLAILEGMYFNQESTASLIHSKHMTFEDAATVAMDAEVEELWLTHFSPGIVEPAEGLHFARDIFQNTYVGHCGLFKEIPSKVKSTCGRG